MFLLPVLGYIICIAGLNSFRPVCFILYDNSLRTYLPSFHVVLYSNLAINYNTNLNSIDASYSEKLSKEKVP